VGNICVFLGIQHALYVEVMGTIFAIEYVQLKGFEKFWLKCDSSLLCQACGSTHIIHWTIKDRWCKFLQICTAMDFRVIYVFMKGNICGDRLINLGMKSRVEFVWCPTLSNCITLHFFS